MRSIKKKIEYFLFEFIMVFLGVLLAFAVNNWAEEKKERKFANNILQNLYSDVKEDSARIFAEIEMVKSQYSSIHELTHHLAVGHFDSANLYLGATYKSINTFAPSTESYQSLIYSGDLKLFDDYELITILKDIDQANQRAMKVHALYFEAVSDIRNGFICKENMEQFNVASFQNKQELWNRLNFLKSNYIKNYIVVLETTKKNYDQFLNLVREKRLI